MKLKLLITTIVLLVLGCTQENESFQKPAQLETELKVINDYVSVNSVESLTPLLQRMAGMSRKELNSWEAKNGFVSLQSILNKAVEEETKYFDKLEAIGEQNLKKEDIKPHAPYVLDNAKYFKFHEDGWFELNIANQDLAPLLNKDGIIVIEGQARKYTMHSLFVSEDGNTNALKELQETNTLPSGVTEYKLHHIRKEHNENSRIVTGSFSVNSCTGTQGRYRVRLYEDVITYFIGPTGTFALDHGFKVKSFIKTIWGWDRNFDTSALAGTVYYQASWGFDGKTIQANGTQNEIRWPFISNYQYTETNPPSIFNSQGQGWGRDGCTCSYSGVY
ncbi:MAG: hypothetical protein J0L66_10535 [Cytophagales bacterium]|jgi:hypothetical protein|nr:hypothetical protein [Cytophagales bacterium]